MFAKLNDGLGNGSVTSVDVVLAWDGGLDCDLAFGLGANNQLLEAAYFDVPVAGNGAARVNKDAKNGYGFSKADESGSVNLAMLPMNVTEVAVAAMVQGGYTLGQVSDADVYVYQGGTRNELAKLDLDSAFAQCAGGKLGEFQRIPGSALWRWVPQPRGFATLNDMAATLMM